MCTFQNPTNPERVRRPPPRPHHVVTTPGVWAGEGGVSPEWTPARENALPFVRARFGVIRKGRPAEDPRMRGKALGLREREEPVVRRSEKRERGETRAGGHRGLRVGGWSFVPQQARSRRTLDHFETVALYRRGPAHRLLLLARSEGRSPRRLNQLRREVAESLAMRLGSGTPETPLRAAALAGVARELALALGDGEEGWLSEAFLGDAGDPDRPIVSALAALLGGGAAHAPEPRLRALVPTDPPETAGRAAVEEEPLPFPPGEHAAARAGAGPDRPAPEEPTPAEPTPAEPTPAEPTPDQSTPDEPAPEQPPDAAVASVEEVEPDAPEASEAPEAPDAPAEPAEGEKGEDPDSPPVELFDVWG